VVASDRTRRAVRHRQGCRRPEARLQEPEAPPDRQERRRRRAQRALVSVSGWLPSQRIFVAASTVSPDVCGRNWPKTRSAAACSFSAIAGARRSNSWSMTGKASGSVKSGCRRGTTASGRRRHRGSSSRPRLGGPALGRRLRRGRRNPGVASGRLTFASAARKQNFRKPVVTHRNGDTENDLSRKD
jgi:hypothetical protein